jgi:hypothetical protein
MLTNDHLSEEFSSLADEELLDRLRSGNLTDAATIIARRELAARDIDVERALAQPARNISPSPHISVVPRTRFAASLARVLRFPLWAVLGLERPWVVFVFGGTLLFLLFRLIQYGLVQLYLVRPIPPYALPTAYGATVLISLAMGWLALALWRSARRVQSSFWKIAVRVFAVLFAVNGVFGTLNLVRLVQENFSPPPASVMDLAPKR